MFNLLHDPLIRMTTDRGDRQGSLPDVYAAALRGGLQDFPALRQHQRHAWHAFLVQLGMLALRGADAAPPELPADPAFWRERLAGLTPEWPDHEPWRLAVANVEAPAFLQPPTATAAQDQYKRCVATPDGLDILIAARNHDPKQAVARAAAPDDWLFALVSLQTMGGYDGGRLYGISRMNGGLGNRVCVALAPACGTMGGHIRRDMEALADNRPPATAPRPADGLLWLRPWQGEADEALAYNTLPPLYIDVCRRVRLEAERGVLAARMATSRTARVDGRKLLGRTGDPWVPTDPARNNLPLTLSAGGFTYKLLADILTLWDLPVLLRPTERELRDNTGLVLLARSLVRGQGRTEGYHERTIPIHGLLADAMAAPGGSLRTAIANIARERMESIATASGILHHALLTFMASDPATTEQRVKARRWGQAFNRSMDADFFESLQMELACPPGEGRVAARNLWLQGLVARARRVLVRAQAAPPYHKRSLPAADALHLFEGRMRGEKGLPAAFPPREEPNT